MQIRELLNQTRDVFEGYCRSRTQYAYLGDGEGLTRILGKYLMYVDTEDTSLAPHLIMSGYWEPWITLGLLSIERGQVCVDIGANHGYFSLLFADLAGSDVYAFEPQPKLARLLRQTAAVNGFADRLHVMQLAVGEEEGSAKLVTPSDHRMKGSTWCEAGDGVGVVTLDEAIPGKVDFIKMDAEGYEPKIWAGMRRHLENKPTILMEFTPSRYDDVEGFLREIQKCYTLRELNTAGNIVPVSFEAARDERDFIMLWLEAD